MTASEASGSQEPATGGRGCKRDAGKGGIATDRREVTNHTLRRTFAALLYEAGASPAYVMSQIGHT
ncbi:MAG: site-specific integrase [Actinobacteria bacterium]|nr:MAG: site-specific integrase [Actinomycetota bacterium]